MKTAATISVLVALSACRLASAANNVKTVAVPDHAQPQCAKTDGNGTIHLLYQSTDGPRYVKSIDAGKSFSRPIAVVGADSRRPRLEFTVWDMAVEREGRVHVAIGTNAWALKLPQEEWGYYYTQLEPGGENFAPLRNINRQPSEGFSLAADQQGRVTACWLSGKLYANVSLDHGQTFGPNVEIEPGINPCDCCTTSCTYAADGKLAVLYREETNNDRDMHVALWDQDAKTVTRTCISTTMWKVDACPMTYFSVTRSVDGFAAAWPTKGQVFLARLDTNGRLRPPGEIKTPGTTGMRVGVLVLANSEGTSLVAWKEAGQLHWQHYDRAGSPLGSTGAVESAGSGVAGVVDKNNDFILFR